FNLEYCWQVVCTSSGIVYPESVVGTNPHTTMIDILGVVGWGVGESEAKTVMLGQLTGRLNRGVTTEDLVLTMIEKLRNHDLTGKVVEFYGEGMCELSVAERASIASMSPVCGAKMDSFLLIRSL
ncbi:hypothetical protein IFM89_011527, partial [Coptis chinensis]